MLYIPLNQIPNQSLTLQLDGSVYNLILKDASGITSASISRDNVVLVSNTRALPGYGLIPYRYLQSGNFVFLTMNEELPSYLKFGDTQLLYFFTKSEIEALSV